MTELTIGLEMRLQCKGIHARELTESAEFFKKILNEMEILI